MDRIIRKINTCMSRFFEVLLMYTELDDSFFSSYPGYYDEDEERKVLLAVSFICEKNSVKIQDLKLYKELLSLLSDATPSVRIYEDVMKLHSLCIDITKPFCRIEEFSTATGKTYYEELLDTDISLTEENTDITDICNEITVTDIKRIMNEEYGLKRSCGQIIKAAKELGYEYNVAYDTVVCPDVDCLVGHMNKGAKKAMGNNNGYKKKLAVAILGMALLSVLLAFKTNISEESTADDKQASVSQQTESLTSDIAGAEEFSEEQVKGTEQNTVLYNLYSIPVGSVVTISGLEGDDYELSVSDEKIINMIATNKISAVGKGTGYVEIVKSGMPFGVYRFDVE